MSKKTLFFLGLVGLIIIFLICAMLHWRSIEEDIAKCSNKILNQENLITLTANTHDQGRTVMISGVVESEADKQKALELLKDQCHMTGLEHNISVVMPKPTIKPSLSLQFKGDQVDLSGKVSDKNEINKILLNFTNYRLNQNINSSKDVVPSNFAKYLSSILPHLKQVSELDINLTPNIVKLKGIVESKTLKFTIGKNISDSLSHKARLINMLQVVVPEKTEITELAEPVMTKPLTAVDCQKVLSALLMDSNIHFNSGSAVIANDSIELLNKLANTTKSCQAVKITIIGHTDSSGNAANNIKLSQARAIAVVQHLKSVGVQPEKISSLGVGSTQPITTNETAQGRSKNRRIEFKVHSL